MPVPSSTTASASLQAMRVLLTRPESQSAGLRMRLSELGAVTESLPALEIIALPESAESRQHFMNIDRFDTVIFVSPNAAQLGAQQIDTYWPQLPEGISWIAVGRATAETLLSQGIVAEFPLASEDSEGMLSLPALADCRGKSILIVRGAGGRELLSESLRLQGARVNYAEVYERVCPACEHDIVKMRLAQFAPDVIILYSGETLQNLLHISDSAGVPVRNRLILVPGERVAEQAKSSGFVQILIPASLKESDIIHCLEKHWQRKLAGT